MPTTFRRKGSSVTKALEARIGDYPFYQAVRLLERASLMCADDHQGEGIASNPVAKFTPPASELIRFSSHLSLGFPEQELVKLSRDYSTSGQQRWRLWVGFLALAGSTGALPFHYTELIFQRLKLKDQSLQKFFDLFHHRTISLFYQSGTKYRLPLAYERHKLTGNRYHHHDDHTHALLSLIGMGTKHLTDEQQMPAESLLYFAGILSQNVRPATSLQQMLTHYFDVPVTVEEYVGKWHELIDDVRTRLPYQGNPTGQSACLGRSAILGGKGWFVQGKMRLVIGPLHAEQFQRFGPGTRALARLNEMTKVFAGVENEAEYVLRVSRRNLPNRIQLNRHKAPILGWNTWLEARPSDNQGAGEMLDISVTSNLLN